MSSAQLDPCVFKLFFFGDEILLSYIFRTISYAMKSGSYHEPIRIPWFMSAKGFVELCSYEVVGK